MTETDAGAAAAVGAHNPDDPGSTPGPATTPGFRIKYSNRGANGGTTKLPSGTQWRPGIQGFRERYRRHKHVWDQFEKLCARDGYAKATRERLLDFVAETTPASELIAMTIVFRAKIAAESMKTTWVTALNRALNELEEAEETRKKELVDPSKGVVI